MFLLNSRFFCLLNSQPPSLLNNGILFLFLSFILLSLVFYYFISFHVFKPILVFPVKGFLPRFYFS